MTRNRAAGAAGLVICFLLALPACGQGVPDPPDASAALASSPDSAARAPETPDAVLQAVGRAMGETPETVAAGTETLPPSRETGFGALIGRVVGVLAFILGLLYVSLLGMKKVMSRNQTAVGSRIQVLGRTPLSPKANVYLLRFQDRYFLVGEAGERLTSLASLPVEDAVEIEDGDAVEIGNDEPEEAEVRSLRDLFSRPAAAPEIIPKGGRTPAGSGGSEKKLRQDAINLLKIQLGVPDEVPGSPGTGRNAGRCREARAGAS